MIDADEDGLFADRALFTTHKDIYKDPEKAKPYITFLYKFIAVITRKWKIDDPPMGMDDHVDDSLWHYDTLDRDGHQSFTYPETRLPDMPQEGAPFVTACSTHETNTYMVISRLCNHKCTTLTSGVATHPSALTILMH